MIIQSIFIDPTTVAGSSTVQLTSVNLYFKTVPASQALVRIVDFNNNKPDLSAFRSGVATGTAVSSTDGSTSSVFTFDKPVVVPTGVFIGLVIDIGTGTLWQNKSGEDFVGTTNVSPGLTGIRDLPLYSGTYQGDLAVTNGTTIKFAVNVAKFSNTSGNVILTNQSYEFFTANTVSAPFQGGENVYGNTTPLTGTIAVTAGNTSITGIGTSFTTLTVGQRIVIVSANVANLRTISSIANNTSMQTTDLVTVSNTSASVLPAVTGIVVAFDQVNNKLVITGSNASSARKFTAGMLVSGEVSRSTAVIQTVDNVGVGYVKNFVTSQNDSVVTSAWTYNMAYSNGSVFIVDNAFDNLPPNSQQAVKSPSPRFVLSRSNEVSQSYLYANNKSVAINVTISTDSNYAAPVVDENVSDLQISYNNISNTINTSYANGVVYDSEVLLNGIAKAKHFTTRMTFESDRQAEDLRVYCTAYKPVGTELRLYARIHNVTDSEPVDDKYWSPLEIKANANAFSSSIDTNDLVEYEYGLPLFPTSRASIPGGFVSSANSAILLGSGTGDLTTQLVVGDLVKYFNTYFPLNYGVARVVSANSTAITLDSAVNDGNVIGPVGVEVLTFNQAAFSYNTATNLGVCRYYNSTGSIFDRFTSIQVKAVMLSNNAAISPAVTQLEVIALSV